MKFSLQYVAVALATSASAFPITLPEPLREFASRIVPRQSSTVGTTANEFLSGGCRDIVLLFARGTSQAGNMGDMPGPTLANSLKTRLGAARVAAQGVAYSASLLGNLASGGTPAAEAATFTTLIGQVATQCPSAKIVVSGYSQGAAMVHRAVEGATAAVRARISAAVTFGDTQRKQDNYQIPNFDTAKTLIICNNGDLVCDGTLIVTSAHSNYNGTVPTAVEFIAARV